MTELESVGERIKLAREASGISQSEMARKLDVARQTYIQLESQKSNPRLKCLGDIADITNSKLPTLIGVEHHDDYELEKIRNKGRNEGVVYACLKLAQHYDLVPEAMAIIELTGITIDCGRPKDVQKLKRLVNEHKCL